MIYAAVMHHGSCYHPFSNTRTLNDHASQWRKGARDIALIAISFVAFVSHYLKCFRKSNNSQEGEQIREEGTSNFAL